MAYKDIVMLNGKTVPRGDSTPSSLGLQLDACCLAVLDDRRPRHRKLDDFVSQRLAGEPKYTGTGSSIKGFVYMKKIQQPVHRILPFSSR